MPHTPIRPRGFGWLYALIVTAAVPAMVSGQPTFTWTPNNNPGNWTNGNNWVGGNAPTNPSTTTYDLTFGGAGGYTATNGFAGDFLINTLTAGSLSGGNPTVTTAGISLNAGGSNPVLVFKTFNSTGPSIVNNMADGVSLDINMPVRLDNTVTVGGAGNTGNVRLLGGVSGTGGVVHNGDGSGSANGFLTLAGDNTYSGGTTLSGGVLVIGATNTASGLQLGTGDLVINGGRLRAATETTPNNRVNLDLAAGKSVIVQGNFFLGRTNATAVNTLVIDAPVNLGNSGVQWQITVQGGTDNVNQRINGAISGTSGIEKLGPDRLILDNDSASRFTGGLKVSAGTVRGVGARSFGAASNVVTLASGTTLELRNDVDTGYNNPLVVSGANASVTVNADKSSSSTGANLAMGALTVAGGQTFNVTGADGFQVRVASVTITSGTPTFTTTVNQADFRVNGAVAGSSGFIKAGSGVMTLAGDSTSTLSGTVNVANGTLRTRNDSGSATGSGQVVVSGQLTGTGFVVPVGQTFGVDVQSGGMIAPSVLNSLGLGTTLTIGSASNPGSIRLKSGAGWQVRLADTGSFTPAGANTGGSSALASQLPTRNNFLNVVGSGSTLTVETPSNLNIELVGDASLFTPGTYSFLVGKAATATAFTITGTDQSPGQFNTSSFSNMGTRGYGFELVSDGSNVYFNLSVTPEPGGMLALAAGGVAVWGVRRERQSVSAAGGSSRPAA